MANFDLKHFDCKRVFTLKAYSGNPRLQRFILDLEAGPVLLKNCYRFGFFCPFKVTLVMMVTMRKEGTASSTEPWPC